MKKFMTVLLVIAVMFTFSFSTAFAAPADNAKLTYSQVVEKITTAANAAKVSVERAKDAALYTIFGSDATAVIDGVTISKTTVEKIYDKVILTPALAAIEAELETNLDAAEKALTIDPSTSAAYTTSAPFSGYFVAGSRDTDASGAVYPTFDADFSTAVVKWDGDNNPATADNSKAVTSVDSGDFLWLFEDETDTYANAVGVQAFKDAKAAAIAAVRAIDLTAYSKEYKNQAMSNYDIAAASVAKAIDKLNNLNLDATPTWGEAKTLITSTTPYEGIYSIYKAGVNQADPTGELYTGGLLTAPYNTAAYGLNNLPKVADEPTAAAKLEWAKAKVLTALSTQINSRLNATLTAKNDEILTETIKGSKADADKIAAANVAKEEAQEEAAAALEVVKFFVEECDSLAQLIQTNVTPFGNSKALVKDWDGISSTALWYYNTANGTLSIDKISADTTDHLTYTAANMVAIADRVAELKAEADILKASVMIDGAEYVAIEDALEDAIEACYKVGTVALLGNIELTENDAQVALWNRQNDLVAADTVKINGKIYNGTGLWTTALEVTNEDIEKNNGTYDKDLFDEVRAARSAANTAIYAAKTIEEAEAAFIEAYENFDAIAVRADRTVAQATKEFTDLLAKYQAELAAYINYKEASIANAGLTSDYSWTKGDADSGMLKKLYADLAKAYTTEELTAAYTAAKAEIDGLKTIAELDAAKKALDARVAAVKNVTVADRETIATLIDDIEAHNDYCDKIGAAVKKVVVKTVVYTAMDTIQKAEERAIEDAIKAIGTVTLDDAAAIAAVQAQLDAFVKYYAGTDAADSTIAALKAAPSYLGTTVANLQTKLEACKVAEFKAMVGKLAANGSDVEGIKAARAAYEGLKRASKISVYRTSQYDKLLDLEKLVVIADEVAVAEKIAAVEGMKIKANSSAKKGSITVKWTVDEEVEGVKYQVYKSTKAQKGYKKAITTSKTSFKNTKNLTKGTRYFYKVRAIAEIEGVTYYSDWSNKANRIAK